MSEDTDVAIGDVARALNGQLSCEDGHTVVEALDRLTDAVLLSGRIIEKGIMLINERLDHIASACGGSDNLNHEVEVELRLESLDKSLKILAGRKTSEKRRKK